MFFVPVWWISVILWVFFMSYSEMHIALTNLYLKGSNGAHYDFLNITVLRDNFVFPFYNSNLRKEGTVK